MPMMARRMTALVGRGVAVAARAAALLLVSTCSEPTAPAPQPLPDLVLRIDQSALTLSTLGETANLTASARRGMTAVPATLTWWSRVDSVASVSLDGRVTARGRGVSMAFVVSDSGGIDSLLVSVQPLPVRMEFSEGRPSIIRGRSSRFKVLGYDASGASTGEARATLSIDDSLVATLAADGTVTGRTVGVTTLRARLNALTISTPISITPYPQFHFAQDTFVLGAGLQRDLPPVLVADSIAAAEQLQVTATVDDGSIAWVTPASQFPLRTSNDIPLLLEGRGVGATRVRISAPGWADGFAVLVVGVPRLGPEGVAQTVSQMGRDGGMYAGALDPTGAYAVVLGTHVVRFISSDTSVLRLTADSAILSAASGASVGFVGVRAGTSTVIATSLGFVPETLTVRVREPGLYIRDLWSQAGVNRAAVVGAGKLSTASIIGASDYFVSSGTELPISLSQRSPSVLRLPSTPLRLAPWSPEVTLELEGLATGVDTVVVSAAGHAPDTLIVHVSRPALLAAPPPTSINFTNLFTLSGELADSIGVLSYSWKSGSVQSIRVVSSDPGVLAPETPDIVMPVGANSWTVPVRLKGPGSATLTLSDPTGNARSFVTPPVEVKRIPLSLNPKNGSGGPNLVLGVRQRVTLNVDSPLAFLGGFGGRLRSTDVSVARLVKDSFPTLSSEVDVVAGATPGSAWIVAEGVGFKTDSIRVIVTGGRIGTGVGGSIWSGTTLGTLTVQVRDEAGNLRVTEDSLFLRVSSTNRNRLLLVDSIAVIPAGSSNSQVLRFNATQLGPVGVRVLSTRPLAPFVETTTTGYTIIDPLSALRTSAAPAGAGAPSPVPPDGGAHAPEDAAGPTAR